MNRNNYIKLAIETAYDNVVNHSGGPFGAIIVLNGEVIAAGRNEVTKLNDPTAHAEIQAIRQACSYLQSYQLTDCELYSSCEPCPMCIGAIYWARPKAVYFAGTKEDAAEAGFDDHFIYEQIALPLERRTIKMEHVNITERRLPFQAWMNSSEKLEY